ncbi:Adenylate cyclase [Syntrophobacter sp. SbD1]|nr:Adenylate cyclase [Syntrophobacter sp. SbD1]
MGSVNKLIRSSLFAALFISGLVGLVVLVLRRTGSLETIEFAAYDLCVRQMPKVTAANPRIVLIGITEDDIRNLGQWPLPDQTMAQALKILTRYKARAIGIDIYRDISVPPGHEELESVLTSNPRIVAVMKFGSGGIAPPPVLKDTEQIAFNDIAVDPDGVVRRGLLFLDDGETVASSFALRLALLYLKEEGIAPRSDTANPEYIRLGQTTIRPFEPNDGSYVGADARGYQFLLDFKDTPGSFQVFSLTSLLAGDVDPKAINGKIVIMGVIAQDVKDFFYTPYSRSLQDDEQVYGIIMHAHITSQLIRFGLDESHPVQTTSKPQEMFWVILWSFVGGGIGLMVRPPVRFSILVSSSLLALGLIVYCAFMRGWWVPLVPPAMSLLGSAGMVTAYISNHENRQRAFLMQIFSRHVSKEVAESIWLQRDKFLDGGRPRAQKQVVTTLFSDLKGFTPVGESMDPLALIDWLNMYLETMASLISNYGGVVDDYAGDGIKASFGVPSARTSEEEIRQDAINAVDCALAMGKEMCGINSRWRKENLPTVGLRVGVLTGAVVAGALGSTQRLKYTTVGNAVNAASRLESYDKESFITDCLENPCRILIGEPTLRYLGDRFETQKIGKEKLRGLDQEIVIYRVLGRKPEHSGDDIEEERT